MNITFRLVGVTVANRELRQDAGIDFPQGSNIADALAFLQPDEPGHMAVFLNGEQVEETEWAEKDLSDTDEVVLIRPLEGGNRWARPDRRA